MLRGAANGQDALLKMRARPSRIEGVVLVGPYSVAALPKTPRQRHSASTASLRVSKGPLLATSLGRKRTP